MAMQFESEEEALVWEAHQRSGLNGNGFNGAYQQLQRDVIAQRPAPVSLDLVQQSAVPDGGSAAADIGELRTTAEEIVGTHSIASRDRLVHLRSVADRLSTRFTDGELRQALWAARRQLNGAAEPIPQGGKLVLTEAPWLWQDIILLGCTNLVVALPKVGKSRLMTQMLGRMVIGAGIFLGKELATDPKPILIVGTDQNQRDWARCLSLAGLVNPDNSMHGSIAALFHKGCPLHLDEEGIDRIVGYCEKHPGLVILLDSYAACTAQLGLDENSSAFAEPLIDLQEAIAPYDCTLVVIHHSSKGKAGQRASMASRGGTALPAAVSQTIDLSWAQEETAGPVRDPKVKLSTEGRESQPIEIWIQQIDDGRDWMVHGSGAELAFNQRIEQAIEKLSDRQHGVLSVIVNHWQQHRAGLDAGGIARALGIEDSPTSKAREAILGLVKKRLIEPAGERTASGGFGGRAANLYRPIPHLQDPSPNLPLFPLEPLLENVIPPPVTEPRRGKSGKRAIPREGVLKCESCGIEFHQHPRGRNARFCSGACRSKAHRHRKALPYELEDGDQ
jgi:hypothetical protein